jgi:UDP-glucuronate 4-epimerase
MHRDFFYIDDIVDGVIRSIDQPPADDGQEKPSGYSTPHRLCNIGNSRPEPLMDLIETVEEA